MDEDEAADAVDVVVPITGAPSPYMTLKRAPSIRLPPGSPIAAVLPSSPSFRSGPSHQSLAALASPGTSRPVALADLKEGLPETVLNPTKRCLFGASVGVSDPTLSLHDPSHNPSEPFFLSVPSFVGLPLLLEATVPGLKSNRRGSAFSRYNKSDSFQEVFVAP